MGYKLYTANFKDRIGLGSDSILIQFLSGTIIRGTPRLLNSAGNHQSAQTAEA
jgi:hypothetical protein